jgi:mRNA interferase MazF
MITSQAVNDSYSVDLTAADFVQGSLPVDSRIRPTRLFTADQTLIVATAGSISKSKLADVYAVLQSLFKS